MDLISKKELLALTGISYGQLYRWKREKLIPEEWFIKQSAYTGQETFFPRQQILSRVQTILDAKDRYSLEELSRLLSPERVPGFCSAQRLGEIAEISQELRPIIAEVCPKERYEFYEVVVFAAVSELLSSGTVPPRRAGDLLTMALGAARGFSDLGSGTVTLFWEGEDEPLHLLLYKTATPLALDAGLEILASLDLGPLVSRLKLKYQSRRDL